jgi:hypothetical protein
MSFDEDIGLRRYDVNASKPTVESGMSCTVEVDGSVTETSGSSGAFSICLASGHPVRSRPPADLDRERGDLTILFQLAEIRSRWGDLRLLN